MLLPGQIPQPTCSAEIVNTASALQLAWYQSFSSASCSSESRSVLLSSCRGYRTEPGSHQHRAGQSSAQSKAVMSKPAGHALPSGDTHIYRIASAAEHTAGFSHQPAAGPPCARTTAMGGPLQSSPGWIMANASSAL